MAVCVGPYPEYLLDAWDTYDFSHDSDNDRPGLVPPPLTCVVLTTPLPQTYSRTISCICCLLRRTLESPSVTMWYVCIQIALHKLHLLTLSPHLITLSPHLITLSSHLLLTLSPHHLITLSPHLLIQYHSYEEFHSIIVQVAGTLAAGELVRSPKVGETVINVDPCNRQ